MLEFYVRKDAIVRSDFLSLLERLRPILTQKSMIVLDQHRRHVGQECREILASLPGKFMFLSTYTSPISAIEIYWSVLKREIRRFMTSENVNVTLDKLHVYTNHLLSTIETGTLINESWRKA
jgi:transposase